MSKLKVKFDHETDNSIDCLGINLEEFIKKIDSIYERLMPVKKYPDDWDVKKTSEVVEVMLEELPDEYIVLMFMERVYLDIEKRIKMSGLNHSGLDKLAELIKRLSSSSEDEDESERKSSKKSKDDDIEDILKEIKDGLGD